MPTVEETAVFRGNPDYSDIVPLPQDEGERALVKIAYSDSFIERHDYLRAFLKKNEFSIRALRVTTECLDFNPANYTTWAYRRQIIEAIDEDLLAAEGEFVKEKIEDNPKNYQVWFHRQWWLEQIIKKCSKMDNQQELIEEELQFLSEVFDNDNKNYHAWQHFRCISNLLKISQELQLQIVNEQLKNDVFNNSAWNHRFYTVVKSDELRANFNETTLKTEMTVMKKALESAANNEAAWNYLLGMLLEFEKDEKNVKGLAAKYYQEAAEFARKLLVNASEERFILAFLVDSQFRTLAFEEVDKETTKASTEEICAKLASTVDPVRKNYWIYRKRQLESLIF